ncbi:SCAN domain-containing protein 3 [Trichonephila clavipes]|nr:SCAN domain-containing protein 3 [Trichonephila clavipes]
MANNQSVRRHLDAFTRGRIIGKLQEGRSVTSVAAEFGIAHSIVSRLWRQFQTTGTAIRGFSSGRPRGTTPADDRYIVLQARRNRRQTAGEIARPILLKMDKWLKRRKFNDDNSDNDNAQVASYEIAELIAVSLKSHNLAEEIILPSCRKIVKTMIGGSADIDICKIPLSNDTIHRRFKDMSENIEQNTAKTLSNSNFALQVEETTDITGNAQLIAFVRFIHENDIINQFLCCRELPDFTTGKHIFQVISSYLEEIKVSWKSCIGICTDGAPAMTGHLKGFVAHVKELNEDILVTHCFLHREALVTKFLPSDLKIVLKQCVKMVNYIKSRQLKSRLFSKLCQAMEAKYESLLLHTEVRWLSRGKVISRVLKLKDEMKIFFEQNKNYEFVHLLENKIWCTKLAYLSDIFVIFNNINSSMQGPNENILNSTDKMVGFKKQITLWGKKAQENNLEKFESVPKDSYKTIKLIVVDHLTTLEERIIHYFPKLDIKKFDWVRNPFLITYTSVFDLTLNEEEELILLSNNRYFILKHSEESINSFWINIRCDYPMIAKKALNILLQFSTSYL